jgi:hypothetical protein
VSPRHRHPPFGSTRDCLGGWLRVVTRVDDYRRALSLSLTDSPRRLAGLVSHEEAGGCRAAVAQWMGNGPDG